MEVIVSVVLDAFEHDEYWAVVKQVEAAKKGDVETLALALEAFGIADLAVVGVQARARLEFLDRLEELSLNPETLEKQMHQAIERNLWLLGLDYVLLASNRSLATVLGNTLFRGGDGDDKKVSATRPDLLLAERFRQGHLLIEFKRPSHILKRDDENQAEKYRDKLARKLGDVEILLIGREVPSDMRSRPAPSTRSMSYAEIISRARNAITYLVRELKATDVTAVESDQPLAGV